MSEYASLIYVSCWNLKDFIEQYHSKMYFVIVQHDLAKVKCN